MLVNVSGITLRNILQINKRNEATYGQIEDKDVSCISHLLVEDDHENNEEVTHESDDDDEGEYDRDNNGYNGHQDLKMSGIHPQLLPLRGRVIHRRIIHVQVLQGSLFLASKKMID